MKIIETSRELTVREKYAMTKSPEAISIKDVSDQTKITVSAFLTFTDVDSKGDEHEMLSILTPENIAYVTQSETFKREFFDIADMMSDGGEESYTIKKLSGISKSGRPFVTCTLV